MYTLDIDTEEERLQLETLLFAALKSDKLGPDGSVASAAWMQRVAAIRAPTETTKE